LSWFKGGFGFWRAFPGGEFLEGFRFGGFSQTPPGFLIRGPFGRGGFLGVPKLGLPNSPHFGVERATD